MFKKILISLVLIGSCLYHVTVLAESTLTSRETEQATQLRSLVEKHLREEWTDKCVFLMMFNNIEHYHRPDFPIMLGSRTDAFCIASFVVSEYGAGKKFYALIEIDAKTDLYGISGSSRNFESVESFLKMAGTVINKNIQESNKFYGAV